MFTLLFSLRDCFRARAVLQAEILALRHHLLVRVGVISSAFVGLTESCGFGLVTKMFAGLMSRWMIPLARTASSVSAINSPGSPSAQRVDGLRCAALHPFGDSPGEPGRIHAVPRSGVDGAAGAKHDYGGVGMAERLPLSAAASTRSSCDVPRTLPRSLQGNTQPQGQARRCGVQLRLRQRSNVFHYARCPLK